MARILFVVAVCYCAICAHVAAAKETELRQTQQIDDIETDLWRQPPQPPSPTSVLYEHLGSKSVPIANNERLSVPKQLRGRRKANGAIDDAIRNSLANNKIDDDTIIDDNSNDINDIIMTHGRSRTKRHAGGHGHANVGEEREFAASFVQKLFQQFGNNESGTMNVDGFERMLKHLGLNRYVEDIEAGQQNDETVRNLKIASLINQIDFRQSINLLIYFRLFFLFRWYATVFVQHEFTIQTVFH